MIINIIHFKIVRSTKHLRMKKVLKRGEDGEMVKAKNVLLPFGLASSLCYGSSQIRWCQPPWSLLAPPCLCPIKKLHHTACTLLTQFINSSSVFSINSVSNQGQIQVNEMLCDIENQVIKVGLVEYSLISTDHHCQHLIFARTRWCTLSDYNIQQKFTLWGMQESRLPFRMDADFCGDTYLTSKTWTTTLEV